MADTDTLYRTLVVERSRRPLHAGEIEDADGAADGSNPLCGDSVHVTLRRDDDQHLAEIRHRTQGCAICAAAADLMAESVRGLTAPETLVLWHRFEGLLHDGPAAVRNEDRAALGLLNAFSDLHEYRSRRRCATLPWQALLAAAGISEAT